MFNNVAKKIKTFAKVIFWVGTIACFVAFILNVSASYVDAGVVGSALVTIVVSALGYYVLSLFIYGTGHLIENTDILVEFHRKKECEPQSSAMQDFSSRRSESSETNQPIDNGVRVNLSWADEKPEKHDPRLTYGSDALLNNEKKG